MEKVLDYQVTMDDGAVHYTELPADAEVFIRDGVCMARRNGEEFKVCLGRAVKFEDVTIYAPDPDNESEATDGN